MLDRHDPPLRDHRGHLVSIRSIIQGQDGEVANVTESGEVSVLASPYPPLSSQKTLPLRQYLTDDGTPVGANDMGVDGSVTPREFYVEADQDKDRYLTSLSVIMGYGTSGRPFQWADGTALVDGCKLAYTSRRGEQELHDGITSNQDLFRLVFDRITADWELRGVGASNDYGYIVSIDLTRVLPPYGVKLGRGTNDRLTLTVRDNAGTAADEFNMIAYGFERIK